MYVRKCGLYVGVPVNWFRCGRGKLSVGCEVAGMVIVISSHKECHTTPQIRDKSTAQRNR